MRFASMAGLMMDGGRVRRYMKARPNFMKGGSEHKVARLWADRRVIKDLDSRAQSTESLFDYLTDLQLANHFFGDDIRCWVFISWKTGCISSLHNL